MSSTNVFDQLAANGNNPAAIVNRALPPQPAPASSNGGNAASQPAQSSDVFGQLAANGNNPHALTPSTPQQQEQPSILSRVGSALRQEVVNPIVSAVQDAYSGTTTPPQDSTEHVISAVGGGGGALQAYRVAKALVDKGTAVMKAKPEQFQQAASDLQQAVQDFHDNKYMDAIGGVGSVIGDVTSLNPTEPQDVGQRIREFGQGVKSGGDLVTPIVKSAADAAMLYGGEKLAGVGEDAEAADAASNPTNAPTVSTPSTQSASAAPSDALSALSPKEAAVTANTAKSGISAGAPETVAPTGEDIQPALQSGFRDILNKAASDNGLDPISDNVSVRDAAQNLANQFKARSQTAFQNVEKVTGINVTTLKNQIAALEDKIDASAIDNPEQAGVLQQKKLAFEQQAESAFDRARDSGLDVDQARNDWNKQLRANELSQKIRNADDGTLGNPNLNPGRLTKPLQKMTDNVDGRAGSLQQLLGEDNASALVQHAENARDAVQSIKEFVPKSATGQQALSKIIANNTVEKSAGILRGGKVVGSTDWNDVLKDLGNLSSEQQAAQFGKELGQVRQYVGRQALKQNAKDLLIGKTTAGKLVRGAAAEEVARRIF